jgi:hypothetical protein
MTILAITRSDGEDVWQLLAAGSDRVEIRENAVRRMLDRQSPASWFCNLRLVTHGTAKTLGYDFEM